jgi:predicted transport protein
MDEDQILQSIIADPDVVDPTIDVSKLRQTTPTSPRLLGDVSGIEGLKFDPTRTDYIRDLYSVYGGGLPQSEILQDPTTMIPQIPVIDTPIDAGGGGGGNGGDGIITPDTTIRDQLIDEGIQAAEDDKGDMMLDEGVPVGEAYPPVDTLSFDDQYQEIEDIPIVPIDTVDDLEADLGAQVIKDFEPGQQNLINQAFSKVGSTASDIMNDLSQIPGAIADYANQTVDILGQKINVGKTLLNAGINKIVGGPISLVFDALGALDLPGGPTAQTSKAQSIGLAGEGQYKDKYGINTQSQFGDYDQYNIDRVAELEDIVADQKARKLTDTLQMKELKDRKEYNKISGVGGDIDDDSTGDAEIATETIGTLPEITEARQEQGEYIQEIEAQPVVQAGSKEAKDQQDNTGVANVSTGIGGKGSGGYQTSSGDVYASAEEAAEKGDGGSKKIVCTMMNDSYGFGSFRNKIWLRHSKNLAPEYQIGYHKIFLPLVKLSKTNNLLKKTLEHIAVHRTIDIRQEARGKMHLLGRIYRKILEPICYIVGKHAKR